MNRISILFLTREFFPEQISGGAVYLYEVTKQLAKSRKYNLFVVSLVKDRQHKKFEVTEEGVHIERIYLPFPSDFLGIVQKADLFLAIPYLIKLIKKRRIDLICCYLSPTVSLPAFLCAMLTRIRKVVMVHGIMPAHHLALVGGKIKASIIQLAIRIILRLHWDKIIAVSKYTKDLVVEFGANENNVVVIPNGVDVERFKPLSSPLRQNQEIVLGFFGKLVREKGVIHLIFAVKELVKKIPNLKLIIAGDGPELSNCRRLCEKYRITDKVEFIGIIDRKLMPHIINSSDIVVLPSFTENMPLIMLEAIACGKVFIGTRVGAVPTIISNYLNGIIVEPGNINELINSIFAVSINKALRDYIGKNAREQAKEYSWDTIILRLRNIIDELFA